MNRLAVSLLLALAVVAPCAAQAPASGIDGALTNAQVYERLALDCLATVPGEAMAFRLIAPEAQPYVRAALVSQWQADGRTVYTGDGFTPGAPIPTLAYVVDEAAVRYDRAGRRSRARTVALRMRYDWTEIDGSLSRTRTCATPFHDTVRRREIPGLEDAVFGETVGVPPRASWVRRYAEPLVVVAAVAVGTALLFSVRSDAAE